MVRTTLNASMNTPYFACARSHDAVSPSEPMKYRGIIINLVLQVVVAIDLGIVHSRAFYVDAVIVGLSVVGCTAYLIWINKR
jgi:hypothetical protein